MAKTKSKIPAVIGNYEKEILEEWINAQLKSDNLRPDLLKESELRRQSGEFLALLKDALQKDNFTDIELAEWEPMRSFLIDITDQRIARGFTPSETATFVLSFKQPLFTRLKKEAGDNAQVLADEIWTATVLLDKLGLDTTEVFQKKREEVITRQKDDMMELSTPVVKLWDGILALPLIGTLDSARTQVVMESLLNKILETGAGFAIIDITGVPVVDTLVAQHLLKTVSAARLMGADCIISGVRPQIAQTIVHLGVSLADVATKANMAEAFQQALAMSGYKVARSLE